MATTAIAYHIEQARRAAEAVQMIRVKAWHYRVDVYANTDQPLAWAFRLMSETLCYHADQMERLGVQECEADETDDHDEPDSADFSHPRWR